MRISLIVAMDRTGLIGSEKGLPWRLPVDLRRFRKLTTGHPIIMGRKTLEQIGGPLKDRLNIVLTRAAEALPIMQDCVVAHTLDDAIRAARDAAIEMKTNEIFVIGGAEVYRQALPLAERIYLTLVEGEFAGNAYFPSSQLFRGEVIRDESLPVDEKNRHPNRFVIFDRRETGLCIDDLLVGYGKKESV